MIRKSGLTLLLISSLFSTNLFAATQHQLTMSMDLEYDFPPQVAQVFSNFLFWTINAECDLSLEEKGTRISVKASKSNSSVNGMPLPKGETIYVEVKDKDKLLITAESGAKVELVNLGKKNIHARCKSV